MLKSEIQTFVPLISRGGQIIRSLCNAHPTPNIFLCLVPPDVVFLNTNEQKDVKDGNEYQHSIAAAI